MQARQVPGVEELVAPDAGSVDDEGGVAVDLGIGRRGEEERNNKNALAVQMSTNCEVKSGDAPMYIIDRGGGEKIDSSINRDLFIHTYTAS